MTFVVVIIIGYDIACIKVACFGLQLLLENV